jgi:hypothetical protein
MKAKMGWIKSAGGPLIFAELDSAMRWCGVYGGNFSGRLQGGNPTDYDRACMTENYLDIINFSGMNGLVLGDMPLETTICRLTPKSFLVVRAFYAESDFNPMLLLENEEISNFADPMEVLSFDIRLGNMIMFDAARRASENPQKLEYDAVPGRYNILTKLIEPDDRTSLLIHRFNLEKEISDAH